ncbi:MAG: LamG-like jellyroll fold domain-containing protein [Candidatus Dojkabacteria bacterium]
MPKLNCQKLAKNLIIFPFGLVLFLLLFPLSNAFADSTNTINLQGKIVRNDTGYEGLNVTAGYPSCVVDGSGNDTCDFRVRYYSATSGGTLFLTEVFSNKEIGQYNGAFNLSLGSGTVTAGSYSDLDAMVKAENAVYVEIAFDPAGSASYTEVFTRMPLQATAYAISSRYASEANTAFRFDNATDSSGYTSPLAGMVYFDTTDTTLKVYDGATWVDIGSGTGSTLWTDAGAHTYLTDLAEHFVLGSATYTPIGASSLNTYLAGLGMQPPLAFDIGADRLTLTGDQLNSGLTVYSNYTTTGAWPLVLLKAEDSDFDNAVLEIVQDGTGSLATFKKGSTEVFAFENEMTFFVRPRDDAPTIDQNRLYNVNGVLYWNGNAVSTGSSSLWTDAGNFTYLTDSNDDLIIGGTSSSNAAFYFDVANGRLGIGTGSPTSALDIAGVSSQISNSSGDIQIVANESLVIKGNATHNITEWSNSSGSVLSLINQSGYASFGKNTGSNTAIVSIGANSTSAAQINLTSSGGVDVTAPGSGDLWWNGTNLYFFDGSSNVDLLVGGAGGGLYTADGSVASGSYLNVAHGEVTFSLLTEGWICVDGSDDSSCTGGQWKNVKDTNVTIGHYLSNVWDDADPDGEIRTQTRLTNVELAPSVDTGTGADGAISITGSISMNVTNSITGRSCSGKGDAPNYSVTALGTNYADVTPNPATPTCLIAGDEVLLINLEGSWSGINPNLGTYETLEVESVSGARVTFKSNKMKWYGAGTSDDSGLGTTNGTQRVMLQRVPQYTDVTINAGATFSPSAFNGAIGGVMFFRATGTVSVAATGSISATNTGWRGGVEYNPASFEGGNGGESWCAGNTYADSGGALGGNYTSGNARTNNLCGGGGGGGALGYSSSYSGAGSAAVGTLGGAGGGGGGAAAGSGGYYGAGGGGGGGGSRSGYGYGGAGYTTAGNGASNGTSGAGTNGAAQYSGPGSRAGGGGGGGQLVFNGIQNDTTLNQLVFGSGGGGGGAGFSGSGGIQPVSTGGSGGGIVLISANIITVSGTSGIAANGGAGANGAANFAGGGGGGGGGSLKLYGNTLNLGTAGISAAGGSGGTSFHNGGAGGTGAIAVNYTTTYSGSPSNPTPTYSVQPYYPYGIYNSPVTSTPSAQSYDKLTWNQTLDTYGKISVQTRSGDSTDPTDGTWEEWRPFTSTTNYLMLESSDTHTEWSGTNATVSEGDTTRDVDYFEDDDEPTATNVTKIVSSTSGGYVEDTISSTDLNSYDYVSFWVRASQVGNTLRIGLGEIAGDEQYEDITIDAADTWQKVYWDISDLGSGAKNAVVKLRVTNLVGLSNTIYIDNVRAEKLETSNENSQIYSTPNNYLQYRIVFTTTNTSYQPKLENISITYNSGYRIVIYDEDNVRLYNYSGQTQYLKLDVGTSSLESGGGSGFANGIAISEVADGVDAVAFTFNTSESFTNPSSKLFSVMNNSVEKMYLDAQGNLYVSGTITAGKGLGVALINNSGTTVTQRSLVTLDPTLSNSFKTTTIQNQMGAFGVVQGVEVNGDIDGDGNCDNGDSCLIALEGLVDVNLDNAAASSNGDYIYSSTTAGQGYSSSEDQMDGLVGVVASIANQGSGYVRMVFNAQNQVQAGIYLNIGFDKNAYKDMYFQLSNDYNNMTEAERRGILESVNSESVMFDNFVDGLKMDGQSTVGLDSENNLTGLWGGLSIDGTILDSVGNRYFGSSTATLVKTFYYDRTQSGKEGQDSTPETLVDLGTDPNWYNGVSLQTATNISTFYNGGLVKVSGTYGTGSEHGAIDLTITGSTPTGITANIVSTDGTCSVTGATLTFNLDYAFVAGSCSGSDINIKIERNSFNNGDKFRIASWLVEPITANDRGSERVFPQRALIVASSDASNGYLTIINADTQEVWMKFTQSSTGEMLGVALNSTLSSIDMNNGELSIGMNSSAGTGMYAIRFNSDEALKYSTSGKSISNKKISDRNIANTYSVVNASEALVNNIVNDISSAVVPNQPTQEVTVSGWGYIAGNGTYLTSETVYLPYKFTSLPNVQVTNAGSLVGTPTKLSDCSMQRSTVALGGNVTDSSFWAYIAHNNNTTALASTDSFCYTWTATGTVAPKQYVAVGTDAGVNVMNETQQSSISIAEVGYAISEQVFLTSNGSLYYRRRNSDGSNDVLRSVRNIAGFTTNLTYPPDAVDFNPSTIPPIPGAVGGADTDPITSIYVTEGTSTAYSGANTIYLGMQTGVVVIQEDRNNSQNFNQSSVKRYTKDYISEQMVGDVRGMWPLNYDNTSADNEDISVKTNSLTAANITSADAVSGVRGTAVDFNGTDEYLYRADDADFDIASGNLSFGAWIKPSSVSGNQAIFVKGNGDVSYNWGFGLNNDHIYFFSSGTPNTYVFANSSIATNTWQHIALVVDGSLLRAYVNGQEVGSTSFTSFGAANNYNLNIGYSGGSSYPMYYAGSIDEPFVTATAIQADQIKNMYESGMRALNGSHSSADTYNQLNGTSDDIRDILVTPDSKYMYVGTEGGGISKIDLNSDTRTNAYTTATDPTTTTNNIESLSGRNYPIFAGDIGSTGALLGIDSNGNNDTGIYYSNTVNFESATSKAYLWLNAYIDPDDTSSSIAVAVSNDDGATYIDASLSGINTTGNIPEYSYSITFPTAGKDYKIKITTNRDSSKTSSIYVTQWGLAQMDIDGANGNGLFTNQSDSIASGSYLEVVHGQNTYNLIAKGWVFDADLSKWIEIQNTDTTVRQSSSSEWSQAEPTGIIKAMIRYSDVELSAGIDVGTGGDGSTPTISSTVDINTTRIVTTRNVACPDAPNYNITAFNAAGTEATVTPAPDTVNGCLVSGDEVLIINLQGTYSSMGNVGNYETLEIESINGTTITFKTAKINYYGDSAGTDTNLGTTASTQRVMMQRVPNYVNVTIGAGGSITPSAWNGVKGGVVFFRASGTITVGGSITASSSGYRGATTRGATGGGDNAGRSGGAGGEAYCGLGGNGGVSSGAGVAGAAGGGSGEYVATGGAGYCGGGGGGSGVGSASKGGSGGGGQGYNGGGGAGGYGTAGTGGGGAVAGTSGGQNSSGNGGSSTSTTGGGGGGSYGVADLSRLMFGSSGGKGVDYEVGGDTLGDGGNGGGILGIFGSTITVSGSISSAGGVGENNTGGSYGGGGGGGAGGSIILSGENVNIGSSLVNVNGGTGGTGQMFNGGTAGSGRIAISYLDSSLGTTANPTVTETYTLSYYNYGIYNSAVIPTPNAESYSNLRWTSDLDTYGKISVQTRSGSSIDPTDGTWEEWKSNTADTNYLSLVDSDDNTLWSDINSTRAEGDVTRDIDYFEDEDETVVGNTTKMTTSTNGGYLEATLSPTDLTNYDYVTAWVRSSQTGTSLRLGMGETAGDQQYEDIYVDASNTWQKVYWDISDIATADKNGITKIRLTNQSATGTAVTVYVDNVNAEKLTTDGGGSKIETTGDDYFQYRVIFTTTNLSYQPKLYNINFVYKTGFKIEITDANTVRLYNNSGEAQKLKLDVILGGAVIDLQSGISDVTIAPSLAQTDGDNYTNSIWINKIGLGGNLLKLQTGGSDMLVVNASGDMSLNGDIEVSGGTLSLGSTGDQGSIKYNASTNMLEFTNDGTSWMSLGEKASKFILSAEYPGAVFSADGTNNSGNMTADNEGTTSDSMNYYEWLSAETSLNDYDLRVRFELPSDFDSWGTGGIEFNLATESTSAANNMLDFYVYKADSTTIDGSSEGQVSSVAGEWKSATIAGSTLAECVSANDVCMLVIKMSSANDNYTRVGDIEITYDRKL